MPIAWIASPGVAARLAALRAGGGQRQHRRRWPADLGRGAGPGRDGGPQNAEIVTRLLDAGAIVLGKSNLPDFALDGTNTLSSVAGQTRNPYNLGLSVYGSSGGSAAAIASSLGVLGLGTDTYGSLVQPASATALVTLRPTQGLVAGPASRRL